VLVEADLDGVRWRGTVAQIVVGNTRLYGGIGKITPGALVDDGLLDVAIIDIPGVVAAGRQIASLLLRHRPSAANAEWYRVSSLSIHAPYLLPLQLDGGARQFKKIDPDKAARFSFSVIAGGVTMLVPRIYSGGLFMHGPLLEPLIARPARASTEHEDDQSVESDLKRALRVIEVGAGALTAVRLKSGRAWTVQFDEQTCLEDQDGHATPMAEALAAIPAGALVQVDGEKDRERHIITARAVRLLPSR
jgi:hypothetical protein